MKYLFLIILLLTTPAIANDGVKELKEIIDYKLQKKPHKTLNVSIDRGKTIKALRKFDRVGFMPVITILPIGASFSVGSVSISHDRRYVRLSLTPFFSSIGNVSTFSFGR